MALSTSLQERQQRDSLGEVDLQPSISSAGQRSAHVADGQGAKNVFSILMTPTKHKGKKGGRKKKDLRYMTPTLKILAVCGS